MTTRAFQGPIDRLDMQNPPRPEFAHHSRVRDNDVVRHVHVLPQSHGT